MIITIIIIIIIITFAYIHVVAYVTIVSSGAMFRLRAQELGITWFLFLNSLKIQLSIASWYDLVMKSVGELSRRARTDLTLDVGIEYRYFITLIVWMQFGWIQS